MDLTDPEHRERWRHHLSGLVAGRKVVCGVMPLAAMTDLVSLLARASARKPLLVYTSQGAGPLPTSADAHLVHVENPLFRTMTEELRHQDRRIRGLPDHARRAVDAYDPAREALWWVGPFAGSAPVDGREVVGGRQPAWAALEDKIVVDELWDAVGFPRSARRVVEVPSPELLAEATRDLDLGAGVVWVADARDGFNGGGEFTRWIVTRRDRARALAFFAPRCDRVRVMPFLDGVPCSIHGIVMPDDTVVLRPVELAILRGRGRRLVYGGQGTSWDPPEPDRTQMRDLARRTGELLRRRVGYRGGFGIDGILTTAGFRPTELNPRFSGGLATLGRGLDIALFQLLQTNLTAARDPGATAAEAEAWALPALDARRTVQARVVVARPLVEESVELAVSWDGERLRRDSAGSMSLVVGPITTGAFAKLVAPDGLPSGERMGPLNAALVHLLDEEFAAGIGPVEPAPDVRRSSDQQRHGHDGDVRDDLADADLLGTQPPTR